MAPVGPWDLVSAVLSEKFPGGPADRLLLLVLLKSGDGCSGANARVSLTGIARRTGLGRETVIACIRRLEALHLLSRELHPYKTTVYAVQVAALINKVVDPTSQPNRLVGSDTRGGRNGDLGVVGSDTQGGRNGDHYRTSSVPLSVPLSEKVRRPAGTRPEEQQHE